MNNEADLRNKALAGDAEAQRELGNRYREFDLMITPTEGEDRFEPTLKEAIHFLSLAAKQGLVEAQVDLANMLSLELPTQERQPQRTDSPRDDGRTRTGTTAQLSSGG